MYPWASPAAASPHAETPRGCHRSGRTEARARAGPANLQLAVQGVRLAQGGHKEAGKALQGGLQVAGLHLKVVVGVLLHMRLELEAQGRPVEVGTQIPQRLMQGEEGGAACSSPACCLVCSCPCGGPPA